TELGKYVAELYIDPLTALYTMRAFTKGKRPTEFSIMHLIASSPDMPKLRLKSREMVSLDDSLMQYLPEMLLGLQDRDIEYEEALAELKTAFFLLDWINEVPEQEICDKYDLGPGDIYSFIESASWIAYAIRRLAEIVPGAKLYLSLLDELAVRVEKGVKRELVELASIPNIGRVRARRLYNAGFRTIDDIAKAGEERLKRVEGIGDALAKGIMSFALKKLSNKS
ncbi:MAG: helix-hairpin-helix domain-containing protein, partial [Fervidicoccaceae archaeon]